MKSLRQRTADIFHQSFEIPHAVLESPETPFKDLMLDSLDVADLIAMLEEETGRKIPIQSFLRVRTLGDIYSLVENFSADAKAEN